MEWAFAVEDLMAGPLNKMTASLKQLDGSLHTATDDLYKFERAQKVAQLQTEKDPVKQQHGYLQIHAADLQQQKAALEEHRKAQEASNIQTMASLQALGAVASGLEEAGGVIVDVTSKVVELGIAFVEAGTQAADFKRDSKLALEALLGTEDAADRTYDALSNMAKGTRQTKADLIGMFKDLSAQGFNEKNAEDIIAAASDVGTVQGKGAQDALLHAIESAQSMGKFDERSLHQLKEVGAANPQKFMAALAEAHHTDTNTIKQMLQAGKISSAEGITTLLKLVQQNTDKGGALGSMSMKISGGDAATQIKNIKENWDALFENTDSGPMVDALKKVSDLLDPTTKSGQKAQALFNHIFKDLGDGIDKIDWDKVSEGFDTIVADASAAWEMIKAFASGLDDALGPSMRALKPVFEATFGSADGGTSSLHALGEALGYVAAGIAGAAAGGIWLVKTMTALPGQIISVAAEMQNAGDNLVQGLWQGIKGAWAHMLEEFKSLVALLPATVKQALGIHSPSEVMKGLGRYTAMGFTQGVESEPPAEMSMPIVMGPPAFGMPSANDNALLRPPAFGAPVGNDNIVPMRQAAGAESAPASGGQVLVNVDVGGISVVVHASGGDPRSIGQEVASAVSRAVREQVRPEIVRYFESVSTESGS